MSEFHKAFDGNSGQEVIVPDEAQSSGDARLTHRLAGYRDKHSLNADGTMSREMQLENKIAEVNGELHDELKDMAPELAEGDQGDAWKAEVVRQGLFGWMQKHKRLFGIFMMVGAFSGASAAAANHAHAATTSHGGGGGHMPPMPGGNSASSHNAPANMGQTQDVHASVDSSGFVGKHFAQHYEDTGLVNAGDHQIRDAVHHDQAAVQKALHMVSDVLNASGLVHADVGGTHQSVDLEGHSSARGDAGHNVKLATERGETELQRNSDLASQGVELRHGVGDQTEGVKNFLTQNHLTMAQYETISQQIQHGHPVSAHNQHLVQPITDFNAAHEGVNYDVHTSGDLKLTFPGASDHSGGERITNEAPPPIAPVPHHGSPDIFPIPPVYARPQEEQKTIKPEDKVIVDPPPPVKDPPVITIPEPPEPPVVDVFPPFRKPKISPESSHYTKHVSKGGENVRSAGFTGRTNQGGTTRVEGGIPKAKNEFSAKPKNRPAIEMLTPMEIHKFDEAIKGRKLSHKDRQAMLKKYAQQIIDSPNYSGQGNI